MHVATAARPIATSFPNATTPSRSTARNIVRRGALALAALGTLVAAANLLHRVVFRQSPPPTASFPRAGDTFASAAEGFDQKVVAVRDGWLVLETRIAPRAPGPPRHLHRTFDETFTVASGTLAVDLPGGTKLLGPGETLVIPAGTPHRPHNPSDTEVVIGGDVPVMPQSFAACLVQVYHFLDATGGKVGPATALRAAALDRSCDSTVVDIPAPVRVGIDWVAVPFARLFGFRNHYPELALHPAG
jgi:mannose-6-phosphate isomerase-like protein (cupin superfamily)